MNVVSHPFCTCVALMLLTLVAYESVLDADFIPFDDEIYVAENDVVLTGLNWRSMQWAFGTDAVRLTANWHPLTWLSLMTDVQCFGPSPSVFHRTSVVLHGINSVLVFLLFFRMTGATFQSIFIAVVFCIHPLHVESVAWISERKDVLSAGFGLIAMHAYVAWARSPAKGTSWYILCLFATTASLLSKQMLVTLPVLLVLIDYWPLRRTGTQPSPGGHPASVPRLAGLLPGSIFGLPSRLVIEKVPLAIISFAFCLVAILSQSTGEALSSMEALPLPDRLGNAFVAYGQYLHHSFVPTNLSVFYPYPRNGNSMVEVAVSCSVISLISILTFRHRHSCPQLLIGWLWFLVSLLPVIGIVQVGTQQMADRYMYMPLIGLSVMVGWSLPFAPAARPRVALISLFPVASCILVLLSLCRSQVELWNDSRALFQHAAQVTSANAVALDCLGDAHAVHGDHESAISCYRQSLAIRPENAATRFALSRSLAEQGYLTSAFANCSLAVRQSADSSRSLILLGQIATRLGRIDVAIPTLQKAIRLDPESSIAHAALGEAYGRDEQFDAALACFEECLRRSPENAQARNSAGFILRVLGRLDDAEQQLRMALEIDATSPETHANLGALLSLRGQRSAAIHHLEQALRIRPDFPQARKDLDRILTSEP